MKLPGLIKTLKAVGKEVESWESPDGSRVLLLPHGGRVLGLFAPCDDENFLWTHAALTDVESAGTFYRGEQWHNSGGDRTWLAPEVDFFFPNYPQLDKYWQQRELDPGHFKAVRNNGNFSLKNHASLLLSRPQCTIELEITKSVSAALNPLRYDTEGNTTATKYAGYTLRTTLQLRDMHGDDSKVGLWNLLQMPHGGDLLVPTVSRSVPKIYMGTIGPKDLIVGEHLVRYKMRASGEHKLGIRAVAITGRVGYIYDAAGETSLVIRNFAVNPSGEYVDVPWAEPSNFGFAFQACNVNSNLGAFSELEYHVPAVASRKAGSRCEDESQVWAFRGPKQTIKSIAGRLLSSEIAHDQA
jgi:uncharacterized protein DUF6786